MSKGCKFKSVPIVIANYNMDGISNSKDYSSDLKQIYEQYYTRFFMKKIKKCKIKIKKQMEGKISVLMPVYNTDKKYLTQAIESILSQTYTNFEFIILDDGSKEYVKEIVKSYNDDRIKFYSNDANRGLAYSRNKLLSLVTGKYIALMDSDDISLPFRFEKQIEYLLKHPDISICGAHGLD